MKQTIFVTGLDLDDLNRRLNKALSEIEGESSISYHFDNMLAVIEYDTSAAYASNICCECQYWDSSNSESDVSGICQLKGKRCRFNCKACKDYKDIRA